MKAFRKLSISILSVFILGGCWDRVQINDLALITALAIDQAEDNLIQVTVQIVIPKNHGGGGQGTGGGNGSNKTTIRSEKGFDISEALSKLQGQIPRRLFWGQCKIFIFGETFAKAGIKEQFDFLVRHPQTRERAYMFVSKGKAKEALELFPPIEGTSADVLNKLSDLQFGMRVTMEQLSIMLKGDAQAAALPIIHILPKAESAESNQTIPYLLGTAVFKKDKMVGDLSEKVTRDLSWLKSGTKEGTAYFKVTDNGGSVSLKPVKTHVKLIPKIEGDTWKMYIKVRSEGDIIVQNTTLLNPVNPDLIAIMDKAFENDIRKRMQAALQEIQKRWKTDILDFSKTFHRKYPEQWEKVKDHWEEVFPKIEIHTEIEARILRQGRINSPGGIPKEETRQ
ncbi:Ger(x)C family spore germination protein [Paenibacillus sp. CGMCC 1.16610]|uniref:Ger(X)C family spore germination protein n=1 Tax=Paenibacillus anseongense TaxID=2682845 RepID=A0ABW9UJR0_9BACL|nr:MULTISPECIES: Ger(x)C family spore germination protein [Paenibacillus]MBA2939857.1 Ger(x)C family spore germination protein [Paenibacillus sp. CGMCC 1.16610]MVQ39517.1 Ger(x)C family spore germination protein [Paenibacillus anseongense]